MSSEDKALPANTSFSQLLPTLQLAVDSTSLSAFKTCPRLYQLSILEGWEPKSTSFHLIFGLLYHGALERYDHKRFEGLSHDDSCDFALDWTLRNTWNHDLNKGWASGDSNKNRYTLIRTILDYLDKFGLNDVLETVKLANGKPAVELSFSFDSGYVSSTGERVVFCGHMDRVALMNGGAYVTDRKTTSHTISGQWFLQFTPHNQFSLYMLAGQIILQEPIKGLIVDGVQIAVGFSRFERGVVQRDEAQLREWHMDAMLQLELMDKYAQLGYWPQNDSACGNYGGCKFRQICSKSPGQREQWLKSDYNKRVWDPLQRRGDI